MDLLLIGFALLYPCMEGIRDPLAFPIKSTNSDEWHSLGFTIRALVGIVLGIALNAVLLVPAYGFYFWIVFNQFTGEGTTAKSDKWKVSVWVKVAGLVICIIGYCLIKIFLIK